MTVRTLIVDDEPLAREGVSALVRETYDAAPELRELVGLDVATPTA